MRDKKQFESQLTPEEAKDLLASVDQTLSFASKDTGFPIHSKVQRQLVGREYVEAFLARGASTQTQEDRLTRSELVLKKLGLLPADFTLKDFLLKYIGRQLGGYYNPKDKTMYLLSWVRSEAQRPVMAHELTHALQDQNYDLAKVLSSATPPAVKSSGPAPMSVSGTDQDEQSLAQRAVIEGQAMVVFIDYMLSPTGVTLTGSPHARNLLSDRLDSYDLPFKLHNAPRVLQETMMFPYQEGLAFEVELLRHGGRPAAFSGVFAHLPTNTHQLLHPDAYLARAATPNVVIPDLRPILGAAFEPYDSGTVGELDSRILARELGRENDLFSVAANWDGGGYVAVKRRGIPSAESDNGGSCFAVRLPLEDSRRRQAFCRDLQVGAHQAGGRVPGTDRR